MKNNKRYYENSIFISEAPQEVFDYVDDHVNFSSHMNKSSWMMGGGKMETRMDEGMGQKIDSHIRMNGKVFGIELSLDEVITEHESPFKKTWQTVGNPKLIIIGHYKMGLKIKPDGNNSIITVFINYDLPKSPVTHLLGILFASIYAKWCVNQMITSVKTHFNK